MLCELTPEERRSITRERAVNILSLIASEDEQLDYEQDVPIANVPGELLCQWFDDFYYRDLPSFRNAFTGSEFALLAEFDAFYDEHERLLPPSPDTIQTWLDDPTWREIMVKAEDTLRRWRELNPED